MKTIIVIIIYWLSLYLAYRLFEKYNKILGLYIDEIASNWPNIPDWLNLGLGIFLFFGCVFAQIEIFFESVIIWLVLSIIVPFFYLPITNSKVYNMLSGFTFFVTVFFAITLFFSVDNSRDIIGKSFISNYNVHYTTEIVRHNNGELDYESEVEVAHVNTGNKALDFTLEWIFPCIYRISIGLIIIFSLLMNISLKEKNKLIKKLKNDIT